MEQDRFKNSLICLFERKEVYPWPWVFADEILTKEIEEIAGKKFTVVIEEYNKGHIYHYVSYEECYELGKSLLEKLVNDKNFYTLVSERVHALSADLKSFSEKIYESEFTKASNKYLISVIDEYITKLKRVRLWGWIPTLADGLIPFISETSLKALKKDLKTLAQEEINEIYSSLTTPKTFGEVQKSEVQKCELIKRIGRENLKIIKETGDVEKALKSLPQNIQDGMRDYAKKFSWVTYNYEGPILSVDMLLQDIQISDYEKIKKEYERVLKNQRESKKKMEKIKNEYSFSLETNHLISIAKEFIILKEYRKSLYQYSYVAMDKPLAEIANRAHLTLNELKFLTVKEIRESLDGKNFKSRASKRLLYSAVKVYGGKSEYLEGDEAKRLVVYYKKQIKKVKKDLFRGQVAYPGEIKGRAQLVLTAGDIGKIKEGDILVSSSTNPDLMSAIKKASAIVTDMGGITCHAAIISRELKIPCIVGTRDITAHVEDNDFLHVDAKKGVVKIIKNEDLF